MKATDRAAAQTHAQHVKDHLQAPHNTPAPPAQETQDQASVSLRPNSGGAAFFANAMQRIVAAQEWDVALHLYGRLLQPLTEAQQNGEERGSQWVRGIVTPPLLHGLVAALWQGDDQDRDQAQQLVQVRTHTLASSDKRPVHHRRGRHWHASCLVLVLVCSG